MLCAGFGAAAAIAGERMAQDAAHAAALWERFVAGLNVEHRVNGSTEHRWRGNISLTFPGISGRRLLNELRDVAVSAGSACAAASGRPSHVLLALGLSEEAAQASLRLGWGRFTTMEEIDVATGAINAAVTRLRRAAA
jgi:cysteine desulfurase